VSNTPCDGTKNAVHTKNDGSHWERDARGIPLCRVCPLCRKAKLSRYRPEVLRDADYDTEEKVDN
jgi:hypothetical protein